LILKLLFDSPDTANEAGPADPNPYQHQRKEPTELLNAWQAVTASIANIDDAISAAEAQVENSQVAITATEALIQYELMRNGRPRVNSEAALRSALRHYHPKGWDQDYHGETPRIAALKELLAHEVERYGTGPDDEEDTRSDSGMSMSSSGLTPSSSE
jgi:hypothetical protein